MPVKRSSKPMFEPEGTPHYLHLTVEQARAVRAEPARLAAVCADRYTQARAAARYGAGLHWAGEYKRCAVRCRRLGERIRGELSDSAARSPSATRPSSHSLGDASRMLPRPAKRPETMWPPSPDIGRQTPPPLHELGERRDGRDMAPS
jgi:hypothetical protein